MDTTATTHLSLCSGYGGIDLGLRRAIPNLRTIAYAEIEAFACENLLARMEGGQLDAAPIWPDLKSFPWGAFRDRVDILSGGYPCQPFSAAGKRLGTEDPRHLWPYIADGIRILRPRLCFFENVEGHISLGLREVIGELESMGYKVSWGIFSAREVGAPHQRKRVFILAHRDRERGQLSNWWRESAEQMPFSDGETRGNVWPSRPGQPQYGWEPPRVVGNASTAGLQRPRISGEMDIKSGGGEGELANTRSVCGERPDTDGVCGREICESPRRGEVRSKDCGCGKSDGVMGNADSLDRRTPTGGWIDDAEVGSAGEIVGNAEGGMPRESSAGDWREGAGGAGEGGQLGNAAEQGCQRRGRTNDARWTIDRPTEPNRGCANGEMEQIEWQAQPSLGGDADGTASGMDYAELSVSCDNRTDELRLLGNGVVPATATLAFQALLAELLNL